MSQMAEDEVCQVRTWLEHSGLERRSTDQSGGFGDVREEWRRGDATVHVTRDRGQWFVDVGRAHWDESFDLDLVAWVIETKESDVTRRLHAAVWADLDHLLPALRAARDSRSRERLGLPPRQPYDGA